MHFKKVFIVLLAALCLTAGGWAEPLVTVDEEQGLWAYADETFQVTIHRREDTENKLVWFEVDLRCSPQSPLMAVSTNPENPGNKFRHPEKIARSNQLVFAMNDDYFGYRVYNKLTPGIVIRDGRIIQHETIKSGLFQLPNLDTMAINRDGSLKVYRSKEMTPQEYLDAGAEHVLCFGPYLIRDGEMNPELHDHYMRLEPRVAIGMVEPYHYVCVVTEGRHKQSKGTGLKWVAEKLMEMGAVEALNLDGGWTAALVFMGEKINETGKYKSRGSFRTVSGMLGAGVSDLVKEE